MFMVRVLSVGDMPLYVVSGGCSGENLERGKAGKEGRKGGDFMQRGNGGRAAKEVKRLRG
jgi:hypothetical protein